MNQGYQNNMGYNVVNQYPQNNLGNNGNGLKIASIILGVLGILNMALPIIGLIFCIVGLICASLYKKKTNQKCGGKVLNIVAVILCCISCVIWLIVGGIFISNIVSDGKEAVEDYQYDEILDSKEYQDAEDELDNILAELEESLGDNDYSYDPEEYEEKAYGEEKSIEDMTEQEIIDEYYPYENDKYSYLEWPSKARGTWELYSFDGTGMGDEVIILFELKSDGTFTWRDVENPYSNYVKGKYYVGEGKAKNQNAVYYPISLIGDEYYVDGELQDEQYKSRYEMAVGNDINEGMLVYNQQTMRMFWGFLEK